MTSDKLPAVLTFAGKQSSISMERALRQIRMLLRELSELANEDTSTFQECQASLDDLGLMIGAIER